jgi:hypothetical protein
MRSARQPRHQTQKKKKKKTRTHTKTHNCRKKKEPTLRSDPKKKDTSRDRETHTHRLSWEYSTVQECRERRQHKRRKKEKKKETALFSCCLSSLSLSLYTVQKYNLSRPASRGLCLVIFSVANYSIPKSEGAKGIWCNRCCSCCCLQTPSSLRP